MGVTANQWVIGLNTVWVVVAAALVFLMEAGFAALEAGFIRSKNSMNVIMKVLMDCGLGMLAFWAVGFAILWGTHYVHGHWTMTGFFLQGDFSFLGLNVSTAAFWIFQAGFAVAMATIVSGAVAERMKFLPYMVFSFLATAVIYPISSHWVWAGWLHSLGFTDFAGSTAVHAAGGWASLAAVMLLGPRIGKYNKDGTTNVLPAHNLPLAMLGGFILWFGWFGFNPGSTLSGLDTSLGHIAVTTNLAAAAGAVSATLFTLFQFKKADPSMAMNGALAGLVAITAGTQVVTTTGAVAIGLVAGALVVVAVEVIDRFRQDDPVGAIAVHGVCGSFGTLAVGLMSTQGGLFYGGGWRLLGVQALGLLIVSVWAFSTTWVLFYVLKKTVGIRVDAEEELEGLDIYEHGVLAYSDLGSDIHELPLSRPAMTPAKLGEQNMMETATD
jgi:Amt family ammonium transporter